MVLLAPRFGQQPFAFRVVAGRLFTARYPFRDFGVAVGTHAGYDILVGVGVG